MASMPYSKDFRMPSLLRVAHVEDDPLDVEYIASVLAGAGIQAESLSVDDERGLRALLEEDEVHIVLSDLSMPGFSGYQALEMVRARSPYLPFVFVSGTMGEESAVAALKLGATDYVLKSNLTRLPAAVERGLREAFGNRRRDEAEAEVLRSQRLDSLAMLAGGLSHDLRNLLQPLLMVSPLIQERTADQQLTRLGELVEDCARRGLDMVASMLSFARGTRRTDSRVDLARLFSALELMLRGSMPRNVQLEMPHDIPASESIEGNDTELQQCLLNLCLNAIQAMPEGGRLSLSIESVPSGTPQAILPGEHMLIRVSDTGTGMPLDVVERLFTPFFTTRKEGTGLGLVSCRRIVENHRGAMEVDSSPGKGTCFRIALPIAPEPAPAPQQLPALRPAQLLLVGEGAGSLSLLADALTLEGYSIRRAQGGAAAIQMLEYEASPDALVLDADMRLMSAVRTLLELQERRFEAPIVLLVSSEAEAGAEQWPPDLQLHVLPKPVSLRDLLAALASLLAPNTSH